MKISWQKASIDLVAVFSAFRLFVMGKTGLGDAEAYYWTWSRQIDWSYYDHPPMVAYLIRFFTAIGGADSIFWTRLPSLLLFIATSFLFYQIAMLVFDDEKAAFWGLLMFILCPIFAFGGLQIVPDIPAAFFWMLFVLLVCKIIFEYKPLLWYPAGAAVGLGLLSKYMVLPLIPATLLMLAWHKEYRVHLKQPHIYLGGVLGLICFSPVLIWNYINQFPSFRFHLEDRHQGSSFELKHMGEAFGGQLLYLSPIMFGMLLYVLYVAWKKVFKEKDERFRVLFWLSGPPLAFFMFITFWTKESEPHWTIFGYLTLFIIWGYLFEYGKAKFKKWTIAALIMAFGFIAIFYGQVFKPYLPLKPKYDITNELYGWDIVGKKILELHEQLPKNPNNFALSHNHILSGPIAFSTGGKIPVFSVRKKLDQFDFFKPSEPTLGANFIFVADNRFKESPDHYYKFEKMDDPVEITIYRHGKWAREFYLYKTYNYQGEK